MVAFVPTMNPLNGVKDENGVNKTESEAPCKFRIMSTTCTEI